MTIPKPTRRPSDMTFRYHANAAGNAAHALVALPLLFSFSRNENEIELSMREPEKTCNSAQEARTGNKETFWDNVSTTDGDSTLQSSSRRVEPAASKGTNQTPRRTPAIRPLLREGSVRSAKVYWPSNRSNSHHHLICIA